MIMMRAGAALVLLFACLSAPLGASAAGLQELKKKFSPLKPAPFAAPAFGRKRADFGRERASPDARQVADWVVHAGENRIDLDAAGDEGKLPFVILDKKDARLYVFDAAGRLRGAAPALLGLGVGDTALPGIGAQELSAIAPKDRVTQAGRFVAELGVDTSRQDVLWVDHDGALAIHRVITTNPKERRAHRLGTPTPLDNRISWGCINVPVKFYNQVVQASFIGTKGIVYILPETKPLRAVFSIYDL